jgi:integrase
MTLRKFFDTTYRPLRLRGRSPRTTALYYATFSAFGKWLRAEGIAEEPAIEHLEELLLARYLEHRASTRSPYTAEKERSQLMSLARLAWERRVPGMERLPTCPPGILPDRVPHSWSLDELRRLFAAVSAAKGRVGAIPAAEWWPAVIAVAYETGERIGAILSAAVHDYERPTVTIQPEGRKGGRRGRTYTLSPETCDRLDKIVAYGGDRLLPWPYAHTYLWARLKKLLKPAGLAGKRIAFHQVRRSAISHIAAAGGDPVAFAGHASAAMTKKWYLDPRMSERGPKPHELLPRLDQPHTSAPPPPASHCAPPALPAQPDGPHGERPAA